MLSKPFRLRDQRFGPRTVDSRRARARFDFFPDDRVIVSSGLLCSVNRYVPELALLAGGVMGVSFAGFSLWATVDVTRSLLAGVGLLYPFAAYAVYHDDDPTGVLPPWPVLATASLLGGLILLDVAFGVGTGGTPTGGIGARGALTGLALALVVVLPPAAYTVVYGSRPDWLSSRGVVVSAGVCGFLLPLVGALVGNPLFGALDGLLVGLAGGFTGRAWGYRPTRRTGLRLLTAGGLAATFVVGVGIATGDPGRWLIAALVFLLGPALYHALTVETSAFA